MKKIIGIITGLMISVLCIGCSSTTNDNISNALIVEDGMIKYSNNGKLEEVIALEDLLTGKDNASVIDSKEIELFVQDGYIVWNYIGETSVHKLIAIEDLVGKQGETGDKGATGATGATGAIGAQGPAGATGATGATGPQGAAGADGSSAYIWVKYLDYDPDQSTDEDLIDTCSNYMGIYYGTLASAPNDIASYQWYEIKGEKGDKGDQGIQGEQGVQGEKGETGAQGEAGTDGTNAYVWIRYLENAPENSRDSDLLVNPNNYMGVYSGSSATAPTEISSYQWFKIKGEQGEKGDKGDQGEKGDTGATGATGPQGPQGSFDLETYYDNLAVVSFSIYGSINGSDFPATRSYNIKHAGKNISVEVDSNNRDLTINTPGDYIIELDGIVSFVASNTSGSTTFKVESDFVRSSVTVDNADGYGYFYAVQSKHIDRSETKSVDISCELNNLSVSFSKYSYEFTFKIHKK